MPYINSKGQTVYQGGESMPVVSAPSTSTPIADPFMKAFVGAMANYPAELKDMKNTKTSNDWINSYMQNYNGTSFYPNDPSITSQVKIPSTIKSSSLGVSSFGASSSGISTSSPISLPSAPSMQNPGVINNTGLVNSMSSSGYTFDPNTNTFVQTPTVDATGKAVNPNVITPEVQAKQERASWLKELLGMTPQKENVLSSPEVMAQNAEVQRQRQYVNDATAQLNAVIAKQNQDLLSTRATASQEGVTEAVYGGIAATINREAAIRALPLQASLSAAQGNLQLAQDYLGQLTQMKTEQVNNNYQYKLAQYNAIADFVTDEEKIQLEELKTKNDRAWQVQTNNIKSQEEWSKIAMENGQSNLIPQINALNPALPTFTADLGRITADIAKTVSTTAPTINGISDENTINTYAELLANGKISLSNVPQNVRNQVVNATGGIVNKPLSDTAIKEIQQSQSAVANLNALKKVVENNLQFVGPISGLARFNPYSQARQVQSEIDRVRQQVGKTLEGGVLRKEDEEKYKKILATLADTPETAIYKIDSLISSLERDINLYKNLQRETGKYIPGESSKPEDLRTKYNY